MSDTTPEAALLDRHPGVREHVVGLTEFRVWRDTFPMVTIDEETLYVVGGDQLKDHDQLIVAWVNQFRPHLISETREHGARHE